MAISQATLATKIQAEIIAQFGAPDDASTLNKFCQAVAKAVVQEIQTLAIVNTTGTVTTGAGAGGSVTSNGTVS